MLTQLNRFVALMALCELVPWPVLADSERSQRLIVDGDTLTVQMTEPLPAGLQTLVVGGDTLMVQVLGGPSAGSHRPAYKSPLAASDTTQADTSRASLMLQVTPNRFLVQAGRVDEMESDKRVAKKLAYGALGGVGVGLVGWAIGLGMIDTATWPEGGDGIGADFFSIFGYFIGNTVGAAVGVSRVDPHDLFGASLVGSVVGLIGGIGLVGASESELLLPSLLVGPVIGAMLASEWSRSLNPSDKKLPFFMNLIPDPRGHLSAVATLRF